MSARTEAGFTLLEVIVALVVLGFVLVGLGQATRFGLSAWTLQTRLQDRTAGLERLDRVLRELIQQASPPVTVEDRPFVGEPHRLVFLTLLPDQPQSEPVRHAQVAIGVDDQHRLVLRWQIKANAIPVAPLAAPRQIVLAEGIARIDLAYRQSAADGGQWLKNWSATMLPALVQIHFVPVRAGTRLPDMQVATMLDNNGSF